MMTFVPVDRGDDVPLGDAGIVEHARQPVEQLLAPAEQFASLGFRDMLFNDVRRQRRGEREEADVVHASLSFRPVALGEIG